MANTDRPLESPAAAGSLDPPRLAFAVRGSGLPIVFVHGLTFDRDSWHPIVNRLTERYRCIAVDLPGHGESDGPTRPLDDVAAGIHDVLTKLAVERPVIVGHSLGHAIAGIYAATYPVSGLVDVDQALYIRPFAELAHRLEPALRGDDFAAAFEPFRQSIGLELVPEPERSDIAARQRIRQDLVLGYWDELFRTTPDELQARVDRTTEAITAPALAVFGHEIDDHERERWRRCVPHVELEEWPGRGHMVHLVEPDRFARRLAEFADTCFRGSPNPDRDGRCHG